MSTALEQLQIGLKDRGFSLTRPRQVVFDALQSKEPQTMHELIEACRGSIDRASVYRAVAVFESAGVVQRLQIGWKYKLELSDRFNEHHHHASCLNCGRTIVLPDDPVLEKHLKALARAQNFKASDHQLEIRGLCQDCQNIKNEKGPLETLTR